MEILPAATESAARAAVCTVPAARAAAVTEDAARFPAVMVFAAIRAAVIEPAVIFGAVIAPSAICTPETTGRTTALSHETVPVVAWKLSRMITPWTVPAGAVTVTASRCQVEPRTGAVVCATP